MSELAVSTPQSFVRVAEELEKRGFNKNQIAREISFACQIINSNPKLQETSAESRLKAVVGIANIGLTLNPVAKEAYLLPRWKSGMGVECCVEPSYIGLTKLLTDSGSIASIACNLVHKNDKIEISYADNKSPIKHTIDVTLSRGEIIGCYAIATLHNGDRQAEWMSKDEIEQIRERSETYKAFKAGKVKSCTWVTDESEMWRKTVIRRIYKYLPRTEQMRKIDEAIALQNGDFVISDEQKDYIEHLMDVLQYDNQQRKFLRIDMLNMTSEEAGAQIEKMKGLAEQYELESTPNHSQKQISQMVKNSVAKENS